MPVLAPFDFDFEFATTRDFPLRRSPPPLLQACCVALTPSAASDVTTLYVHLDVSAGCQRVRTHVTRGFHQGLGRFLIHPRQADVQPGPKAVAAMRQPKIDLGIDSHFRWKRYLLFCRPEP